jgi:hypothetical protein
MTIEEYIEKADRGEYTWDDAEELTKVLQNRSVQRWIAKVYNEHLLMAKGLLNADVSTEEGRLRFTKSQNLVLGVMACLDGLVNQELKPSQGDEDGRRTDELGTSP